MYYILFFHSHSLNVPAAQTFLWAAMELRYVHIKFLINPQCLIKPILPLYALLKTWLSLEGPTFPLVHWSEGSKLSHTLNTAVNMCSLYFMVSSGLLCFLVLWLCFNFLISWYLYLNLWRLQRAYSFLLFPIHVISQFQSPTGFLFFPHSIILFQSFIPHPCHSIQMLALFIWKYTSHQMGTLSF